VGVLPATDFVNFDPMFLGNLAVAGGSAPAGCDPAANGGGTNLCYFEVDPSGSASVTQVAFEAAINTIRSQVVSCTFSFTDAGAEGGATDPSKINVALNGTLVTQGPVDGWTFDDPSAPTAISLHGSACTTAKTTPNATVEILLGCPTKN
jgi:hypothetical protein